MTIFHLLPICLLSTIISLLDFNSMLNIIQILQNELSAEMYLALLHEIDFSRSFDLVNWDDRFSPLMIHLNDLGVPDGVFYTVSRQLWIQEITFNVGFLIIQQLGNLGHRMSQLFNPLFQLAYDVGNVEEAYGHLMLLFGSPTFLSTFESVLHSLKLVKFSVANILHVNGKHLYTQHNYMCARHLDQNCISQNISLHGFKSVHCKECILSMVLFYFLNM